MVFQKLTAEQKTALCGMDIDNKKKASIRCCMMRSVPYDHILNNDTVLDAPEKKPKRTYKKKSIIINEEPVDKAEPEKPKLKRTYKKKEPKAEEDSASIVII